ncbi:Flp pilus assembly protein CpaB [Moritella viscosa]|jgi:pilus assembly protein CpaB|uniref:Flp pilus assembly protein CpaB n=1 Tax=Moritella viscosa TaxID=80854 RepID=UPI00091A1C20|nr:Flp pilus assembly protein CpaB [Moritella viscosa]SGZ08427.1 Flp pilus assembly protein CpaB, putative [Moritella viscosa]
MTAKRLMYISVFISLVGLIGLYMSKSASQPQGKIKTADIITHTVLVANQNIKSGRTFSASLFEWKIMAEHDLVNRIDYISKTSFDSAQFENTILSGDYPAGHIMSQSDFLKPEMGGFLSVLLRPGYRAVSVPVDQVTANSGLVGPGDYVDVLLLASKEQELRSRGNETQSLYVKTITQNVRVLAFNDAVQVERYIEEQKKNKGFIPDNSAVTLEVLPAQANKIILANQLGILSIVLRSHDSTDADIMTSNQITINDIFPEIKQVQPDIGLVEFRAKDKRIFNTMSENQ